MAQSSSSNSSTKSSLANLPRLRGFLELYEDSGFFAGWKKRYFVLQKRQKCILYYGEGMEKCLGQIELESVANVGPTGEPWRFVVYMRDEQRLDTSLTPTQPGIAGSFTRRFSLGARSKEEMQHWVNGIVQWVAFFRKRAEKRASKKTKKQVDSTTHTTRSPTQGKDVCMASFPCCPSFFLIMWLTVGWM